MLKELKKVFNSRQNLNERRIIWLRNSSLERHYVNMSFAWNSPFFRKKKKLFSLKYYCQSSRCNLSKDTTHSFLLSNKTSPEIQNH